MYMTGQKPLTAQRKQQSKRERTPVGTEERHSAAAGLSYEDVRIHYNSQIPLQRRAADHKQKVPLENGRRTETGADRMANYSSEPDLTGKMDEQSGVVQRSPVSLDTIMTLFQSGMKISAVAAAVGLPLYFVYKLIRRCMLQKEGQDVPAALRIAEEEEESVGEETPV